MEFVSRARFIKNTPDKLRILTYMLKGKTINSAISALKFSGKIAARPLILVLKQAKSQARDLNLNEEDLRVKSVAINEGPKLKRKRICHQGRATAILKRSAHINVFLTDAKPQKVAESKGK